MNIARAILRVLTSFGDELYKLWADDGDKHGSWVRTKPVLHPPADMASWFADYPQYCAVRRANTRGRILQILRGMGPSLVSVEHRLRNGKYVTACYANNEYDIT